MNTNENNTEEQEFEEGANLPTAQAKQEYSFLIDERKHNLTKTHKAIDKEVLEAIAFLGEVVRDTAKPTDMRMKAAEKILDSKLKISEQQNKEFLQRLVQEVRKNMPPPSKLKTIESSDDDEDDNTPMYVPNIITNLGDVKM